MRLLLVLHDVLFKRNREVMNGRSDTRRSRFDRIIPTCTRAAVRC